MFLVLLVWLMGCGGDATAEMGDASVGDASGGDAQEALDAQLFDAASDAMSALDTGSEGGSQVVGIVEPTRVCPEEPVQNERALLIATPVGITVLARDDQGRLRKTGSSIELPGRYQSMDVRPDGQEALVVYGNASVTPALARIELDADGAGAQIVQTIELGDEVALKHVRYLDADNALVLYQPIGTRGGGVVPLSRKEDQTLEAQEVALIPNGVPFWVDTIAETKTLILSAWKGASDPNPIVAVTHDGQSASQRVLSSELKVGGLVVSSSGEVFVHSGNHPEEATEALNARGALRQLRPSEGSWALDSTTYWAPTNASELVLSPDEKRMVMVDAYREWVKDPETGVERIAITSQAVYEQPVASLSQVAESMPPSFRLQSSMNPARGPLMPDTRSLVVGWSPRVGVWVVASFQKDGDDSWNQVCDRVRVEELLGVAMAPGDSLR